MEVIVNFHARLNCLATWNLKVINEITKREEVENIFRKGMFKLLVLTETVEREWGDFVV